MNSTQSKVRTNSVGVDLILIPPSLGRDLLIASLDDSAVFRVREMKESVKNKGFSTAELSSPCGPVVLSTKIRCRFS